MKHKRVTLPCVHTLNDDATIVLLEIVACDEILYEWTVLLGVQFSGCSKQSGVCTAPSNVGILCQHARARILERTNRVQAALCVASRLFGLLSRTI
jgi:hypothetical protein